VRVLVTGAAGFIGSHLCEGLLAEGHEVTGYDNLSEGSLENLERARKSKKFAFVRGDILQESKLAEACAGAGAVYHLAADPRVKESAEKPRVSFEQNVIGTFNVLEAARKKDVKHTIFTSTSTVYGDAKVIPTPEDAHIEAISNYGASKLAGEYYIASYAHTYGIKGTALRYANIFGERAGHGVMRDFYFKLKANPDELEILGDGKQDKSYLHVSDCVSATLLAARKQKKVFDAFNVGSREKHKVDEIAKLIAEHMNLQPKFKYVGGKRGWVGDVPLMLLSTGKIERQGWKPEVKFKEGLGRYLDWLGSSA